jgi:hypothetical protein
MTRAEHQCDEAAAIHDQGVSRLDDPARTDPHLEAGARTRRHTGTPTPARSRHTAGLALASRRERHAVAELCRAQLVGTDVLIGETAP